MGEWNTPQVSESHVACASSSQAGRIESSSCSKRKRRQATGSPLLTKASSAIASILSSLLRDGSIKRRPTQGPLFRWFFFSFDHTHMRRISTPDTTLLHREPVYESTKLACVSLPRRRMRAAPSHVLAIVHARPANSHIQCRGLSSFPAAIGSHSPLLM